jgi:hypothetical protein
MVPQSKAKMYLAEERGCCETDWFRSYSTFNFGAYQHEHKTAAGHLYLLNDDTLAPQRSLSLTVEEPAEILLLPVVGAVTASLNGAEPDVWEAGSCVRLHAGAGDVLLISNPYEKELVNYVQLWMKRPAGVSGAEVQTGEAFDLPGRPDRLIPLLPGTEGTIKYFIGKFKGRSEWMHTVCAPGNALFFYVLQGAFEVQYRLLHARDGLWLWNMQQAELEALSNDAIILVAEMPCPV